MKTISIHYENLCELLAFSNSDLFRQQVQKSQLLIIQINSEVCDSYSISRVVADLRIVFPNAKITGAFSKTEIGLGINVSKKVELHFTFSQSASIDTFLNITGPDDFLGIHGRQKSELHHLYNQLKDKTNQIEQINRQITDSLRYAGKVQKAVIPPKEVFAKIFPKHFVIYKPKHYVSGDFFWTIEKDNKIYIAVADCTGHGVPGALLSILGITCLNEISNLLASWNPISASDILNLLRDSIKNSLHQTGRAEEMKDGLDIALCIINKDTLELQYAGAFIPLLIVRDKELIEIKADKMPIGVYCKDKQSFTDKSFNLKKDDMIYLATDGYADQFGGANFKKFKVREFKKLLVSVSGQFIDEQKLVLKDSLDIWQNGNEQTDDITVLGIRIEREPTVNYTI